MQFKGELVQVFFPRPAVCHYLTDEQKLLLHESLDYSLDGPQLLRDFFVRTVPNFASKDATATVPLQDELEWKYKLAMMGPIIASITDERFQVRLGLSHLL